MLHSVHFGSQGHRCIEHRASLRAAVSSCGPGFDSAYRPGRLRGKLRDRPPDAFQRDAAAGPSQHRGARAESRGVTRYIEFMCSGEEKACAVTPTAPDCAAVLAAREDRRCRR